jgi:hypothetical protein
MLYLPPWNRDVALSWSLVARVFTTPPVAGRFTPRADSPSADAGTRAAPTATFRTA